MLYQLGRRVHDSKETPQRCPLYSSLCGTGKLSVDRSQVNWEKDRNLGSGWQEVSVCSRAVPMSVC